MGQSFDQVATNPAWRCPCCLGLCNCSSVSCQRKLMGLKDTGPLEREARALGFLSAAHYLVLTLFDPAAPRPAPVPPADAAAVSLRPDAASTFALARSAADARALAAARTKGAARARAEAAARRQMEAVHAALGGGAQVVGAGTRLDLGLGLRPPPTALAPLASAADLGWDALDEPSDGDDSDDGRARGEERAPRAAAAAPAAPALAHPPPSMPRLVAGSSISLGARASAALRGVPLLPEAGAGGARAVRPGPPLPTPSATPADGGGLAVDGDLGAGGSGAGPHAGLAAGPGLPGPPRGGGGAPRPRPLSTATTARALGMGERRWGGGGGGGGGARGAPRAVAASPPPPEADGVAEAPAVEQQPPAPEAGAAPVPPPPPPPPPPPLAALPPDFAGDRPPASDGVYACLLTTARQALAVLWRTGEGEGGATAPDAAVARAALAAVLDGVRRSVAAPVPVPGDEDGGGGGGAARIQHPLAARGGLADAAAALVAVAAGAPPEDAAYDVPALLGGREPLADWGGSGVGPRAALLAALFAAHDALAARAAPTRHAAAAIGDVATALLAEYGQAVEVGSGDGAWSDACTRVGPVSLPPGADDAAAALLPLVLGDAALLCYALDFAAARGGGGDGGLAGPWTLAPLDPRSPAPAAARERAAHALHLLLAGHPPAAAGAHGGWLGALLSSHAIPFLEASLAADYPLRRGALPAAPGGRGGDAAPADPAAPLRPVEASPSRRAAVLAQAHAWLLVAGGCGPAPGAGAPPPLASLLDRAGAPFGGDRVWRDAGVAPPYRSLATHYAAVALGVAPALAGPPRAQRAALRFWLAGAGDPHAGAPFARLTLALASCPHTAWAFERVEMTADDLAGGPDAAAARGAAAAAVVAAAAAARGPAAAADLVADLAPILDLRRREAAEGRRGRRWRRAAVPLAAAAAVAAAPAESMRRPPRPGARSPLVDLGMLLAEAAADALGEKEGGGADLAAGAFAAAVAGVVATVAAAGSVAALEAGAVPGALSPVWRLADAVAAAPAAARAAAAALATPRALAVCHYLLAAPLRRALERGPLDAGDLAKAAAGAAALVGAMLVDGGWGDEAGDGATPPLWLRTLLPPALAPLIDALCPTGPGAPAGGATPPLLAAAVFGAAARVATARGASVLPPLAPPPPPTSRLAYANGPLRTGEAVPDDRFGAALAVWWRVVVGGAVRAAGKVGRAEPAAEARTELPTIRATTPEAARAARGELQSLLGAPRALPPRPPLPPPPAPAKVEAVTEEDAAVAGLAMLASLARCGGHGVAWAASGLRGARPHAAAAPPRVRAAFDDAVVACGVEEGGGLLAPVVVAAAAAPSAVPPPTTTFLPSAPPATSTDIATAPRGAILGAIEGWAPPPAIRSAPSGARVAALALHAGSATGPLLAKVAWALADAPGVAPSGAVPVEAGELCAVFGGEAALATAAPRRLRLLHLQVRAAAGSGGRAVPSLASTARSRARLATAAPRLPVAAAAGGMAQGRPPAAAPPARPAAPRLPVAVGPAAPPAPSPAPSLPVARAPTAFPARPPLAPLDASAPRPPPPPPPPLVLTPAVCRRLAADLATLGFPFTDAMRALVVARAREAAETLGGGGGGARAHRGDSREEDLKQRAVDYLLGRARPQRE